MHHDSMFDSFPYKIMYHLFLPLPLLLLLQTTHHLPAADASGGGGRWTMLQPNIGIVAIHMQLLHTDKVVIFDRTDFGPSKVSLPAGTCRSDPREQALKLDCTAHSVEYDVVRNAVRPLNVLTDVWCSSGSVMADGTLVQTGGFNDGERVVRSFTSCDLCDWSETNDALLVRRWYASNHALPNGRQIVIGGRREFNYEFYPKTAATNKLFNLPFLRQTNDLGSENNLYPLVILNTDGNLFIFANNRAILLNYKTGAVVKTYPDLPDGNPRSYPSTGSGVLLPLKNGGTTAEVLVCGGAPKGAFLRTAKGEFVGALNTCGRLSISDPNPKWIMETMPLGRIMGDMLLLPNGNVLIINGAARGTAGWERGRNPVLNPVLYKPDSVLGFRFEVEAPSSIPRMYHSSAILLRDGRVLVGGSNPHIGYKFKPDTLYPTELSLEAFSPSYLDSDFNSLRPQIISPGSGYLVGYGKPMIIRFVIHGPVKVNMIMVTMISPSFATHSISMNQRLLILDGVSNVTNLGETTFQITAVSPAGSSLAPPGYYLLYVVHQSVPGVGIWVHLQ